MQQRGKGVRAKSLLYSHLLPYLMSAGSSPWLELYVNWHQEEYKQYTQHNPREMPLSKAVILEGFKTLALQIYYNKKLPQRY